GGPIKSIVCQGRNGACDSDPAESIRIAGPSNLCAAFLSVHDMSDDITRETLVCVSCGRPLRLDAPEGLCPICLLALNSGSVGESLSPPLATAHPPHETDETSPRLSQGETWGDYRIGRLLGRGGMG